MSEPTNSIQEEENLSKTLRSLLKKQNVRTFKRLAMLKRWTLLQRVPKLTVRHLVNLECELSRRELTFVTDDTIVVDADISQRRLFNLWSKNIRRYQDFNKFYRWQIIEILGGKRSTVFTSKGVLGWLDEHQIIPKSPKGHIFCRAGLTDGTMVRLVTAGIDTFEQLAKLSDRELALILSNKNRRSSTRVQYNKTKRAQIREINYILWKNGYRRPCRPL